MCVFWFSIVFGMWMLRLLGGSLKFGNVIFMCFGLIIIDMFDLIRLVMYFIVIYKLV